MVTPVKVLLYAPDGTPLVNTNGIIMQGAVAHGVAAAGNPLLEGGIAAEDADAIADVDIGDVVTQQLTRKGNAFIAVGQFISADGQAGGSAFILDESDAQRVLAVMPWGVGPDGSIDRLKTAGDAAGAGLGVLMVSQTGVQAEVSVTKALAAAGDYAAEDVLSESASAGTVWLFSAVVPSNGDRGKIVKAVALSETTALTPKLTLYLFNATPTGAVFNDNVANTSVLNANISQYVGQVDFPAMSDLGGDSESVVTPSLTTGNLPLAFEAASGANDLIGILVTQDAISGEVATDDMTIKLTIEKA